MTHGYQPTDDPGPQRPPRGGSAVIDMTAAMEAAKLHETIILLEGRVHDLTKGLEDLTDAAKGAAVINAETIRAQQITIGKLEGDLFMTRKMVKRRDAQIASLLRTTCQECGEMTENCIDNQAPCRRCEECLELPTLCKCPSRCAHCQGWKCQSKECFRLGREDEQLNAGRD